MSKWVITKDNVKIEFKTLQEAQNSLSKYLGGIISEIPDDPIRKTVPLSVTPRQIRLALVQSGVELAQIGLMIDALPNPLKSSIEWEYATEFLRADPTVSAMAQLLGWNDSQLDDLWILAATL